MAANNPGGTEEPAATLPSLLIAHPRERTALITEGVIHSSYGEILEAASVVAGRLGALGVGRGRRVAYALPNSPALVTLLLGITMTGAIAAPLNPRYTTDEFRFYLDDLSPSLVLLPEDGAKKARDALPHDSRTIDVRGFGVGSMQFIDAGRTLRARPASDLSKPGDIALLLHTSGTTGRPKQVPLLHRNLLASARSISAHYDLTEHDISYCVMPLFHIHGLVASVFAPFVEGGSVVIPKRFTPSVFWGKTSGVGITWFSAGPTLHRMLLERKPSHVSLPELRFVRTCSSPLDPDFQMELEAVYGVPVLQAYGMTEASYEISANPLPPADRRPGSVGRETGCEVRIAEPDGRQVKNGLSGEVLIRGPGVISGYLGDPRANRESFINGWFRTGDLGRLEDGHLHLVGRIKEIIIRGGENIAPQEVEEVLISHSAVLDAACFGVPDTLYGEAVEAAVSLGSAVDEDDLLAYCRQRLAGHKVPRRIHTVDSIPRTPTGKMQRRKIAQLLGP